MASKKEKPENNRELPEKLEFDFVICDNTLNRNGWRLLVEGIDLSGFEKNPVCCLHHSTWEAPIGKWKNVRVENSQLLGTVEFDRNDEEAVRLYWKYADGFMSACSLSIKALEESVDPAMLMPGQKYSTVTKSELTEVSLVTIPGQKNAVRLSNNNELMTLTLDGSEYHLKAIKNQNSKKMDEEKNKLDELNKQLSIERERNASNLIKLHQKRGVVADGEVEHLKKLAVVDYESVEKMLDARPDPVVPEANGEPKKSPETEKREQEAKELSAKLENFGKESTAKPSDERADWGYYDWFVKDKNGLELMAKNEPEKFKNLEMAFAEESKSLGCVV